MKDLDSDEFDYEWSIRDLDHAPPPPLQRSSSSPRTAQQNRRRNQSEDYLTARGSGLPPSLMSRSRSATEDHQQHRHLNDARQHQQSSRSRLWSSSSNLPIRQSSQHSVTSLSDRPRSSMLRRSSADSSIASFQQRWLSQATQSSSDHPPQRASSTSSSLLNLRPRLWSSASQGNESKLRQHNDSNDTDNTNRPSSRNSDIELGSAPNAHSHGSTRSRGNSEGHSTSGQQRRLDGNQSMSSSELASRSSFPQPLSDHRGNASTRRVNFWQHRHNEVEAGVPLPEIQSGEYEDDDAENDLSRSRNSDRDLLHVLPNLPEDSDYEEDHPDEKLSADDVYRTPPPKQGAASEEQPVSSDQTTEVTDNRRNVLRSHRRRHMSLESLDYYSESSLNDAADDDYEHGLNTSNADDGSADARTRPGHEAGSDDDHFQQNDAEPVVLLGIVMPDFWTRCFAHRRPSWNRVAAFIVTRAPCFWCFGCFHQPTDRAILARLNLLAAFFASFQFLSMIWLSVIMFFDGALVNRTIQTQTRGEKEFQQHDLKKLEVITNVWNLNGSIYAIGCMAFIIVVAAIVTVRVVQNVNLVGAIRYLWVIVWILPFQFFFVVSLFDYFNVTDVWLKHWWRDPTLAWFRQRFCAPGTYNEECTVPILQSNTAETAWCQDNYGRTDCVDIRNEAQADADAWMLSYYYVNASWGLVVICLLLLIVNILEGIISRPLVQKSRESNVPAWLALPVLGCLALGSVFAFSNSSVLNTQSDTKAAYIGPLYLVTGGLFFVAAMLGWYISARSILSTRDKRQKVIAILVFMAIMSLVLVLLCSIFAISITLSASLVDNPIDSSTRGAIACFIDQSGGCTLCNSSSDSMRCPEWSATDVTRILQTQAKGSATLAAIFFLYAISALRFGLGMRHHVAMYQIDFV